MGPAQAKSNQFVGLVAMGGTCSTHRGGGTAMVWTTTKLNAANQEALKASMQSVSQVVGKSIFGHYLTNDDKTYVAKLFVAWDSKESVQAGKTKICELLKMETADWDRETESMEGKMWMTDSETPHKAEPEAGAADKSHDRVIGIAVYHLNVASKANIDKFKDAFSKKAPDMAKIPGKSNFGYYYDTNKSNTPIVFFMWDDQDSKDKGKTSLWNIMMATPNNEHGGTNSTSVHTLANGGMFCQDSDRTYHEANISTSPASWM